VALAVHAGWRGTVSGIARVAVLHAAREYSVDPAEIEVALGPSAGGCCFEIERAIYDQAERDWGAMSGVWSGTGPGANSTFAASNRHILRNAGVDPERIFDVGALHHVSDGRVLLPPEVRREDRPPVGGGLAGKNDGLRFPVVSGCGRW